MKRKDMILLLKLLDSGKMNEPEWNSFSNPEEARLKYAEIKYLRENSGFDKLNFRPFFKEMVMRRVYELSKTPGLDEVLSRLMNQVVLAGTVTIVIVFLLLYAFHGQVGVDTLTGIEWGNEINFISALFNEF